jgi:predicted acyltransferase
MVFVAQATGLPAELSMTPSSAPLLKATGRLVSLDAFRGFTMALMVPVNNAGSGRDSAPPLDGVRHDGRRGKRRP